jgi:hypothetical protein
MYLSLYSAQSKGLCREVEGVSCTANFAEASGRQHCSAECASPAVQRALPPVRRLLHGIDVPISCIQSQANPGEELVAGLDVNSRHDFGEVDVRLPVSLGASPLARENKS